MSSIHRNWTAATDPSSGQTYYFNADTGETSWFLPPPEVQAPPPQLSSSLAPSNSSFDSPPFSITSSQFQSFPIQQASAFPDAISVQAPLVVQARAFMDQMENRALAGSSSSPEDVEINAFMPGQIADLFYLQRHEKSSIDDTSRGNNYEPIDPYKISLSVERPAVEPTRLDTRLSALYKELDKLDH